MSLSVQMAFCYTNYRRLRNYVCLLNMTIYFAHYVHLNEKQKICIPEVPDFDGYHYQESIIAKELK